MGRMPSGPEVGEGEQAVAKALQDVLDAVELGVAIGVGGRLPDFGALEGDAAAGEQAAQRFPADPADFIIRAKS
ncbi:hypothetical protein [Streptomyces sp. NPDC046759]|uniref:hypothetical protein n=1 Tax=Streptomyces sp. NPDC046759 TaxID=3155019 RepID=UPI0033CF159C